MPARTEEVSFPLPPAAPLASSSLPPPLHSPGDGPANPFATRPGPLAEALTVSGVPWVTVFFLCCCAWVLIAAGGIRTGLSLQGLLTYGAKATPLILDRGETWRLLSANLLHKDLLHLAFNAFAIWNVGGALERAVRPADYLALLIFTALGTTVLSAVGSDSISLGASGIAFGVLGASASFGWRRGVRGSLRAHFGLRLVPWLLALFAAGLGSQGVDNWGHGGGLAVGCALGFFLTPRRWPGEGAARRLAAAIGALLGTLCLGIFAAPLLPALGAEREGPASSSVRMPLGWRKAGSGPDRVSYTNGLSLSWRASATLVAFPPCAKNCCAHTAQKVRSLIEDDLWHLADAGALREVHLGEEVPIAGGSRLEGVLVGADGQVQVSAVCQQRGPSPFYLVTLQPRSGSAGGSAHLADRMAASLVSKK